MSDPRRWLDDAALLSPDERRVLEAGLAAKPPADAKRDVLAAVLAGLPNGGAAGPDGGATPDGAGMPQGVGAPGGAAGVAGASGALALVKPAVVGIALGITATAGFVALRPAADPGGAPAATTPAEQTRPAATSRPLPSGQHSPTLEQAPSKAPSDTLETPRAGTRSPNVLETPELPQGPSVRAFPDGEGRGNPEAAGGGESRRVAEARALLRGSNPRAALAALERLDADYPGGLLMQEREALAIEALVATGERAAARRRATDFLTRYPTSPHAASARRALQ